MTDTGDTANGDTVTDPDDAATTPDDAELARYLRTSATACLAVDTATGVVRYANEALRTLVGAGADTRLHHRAIGTLFTGPTADTVAALLTAHAGERRSLTVSSADLVTERGPLPVGVSLDGDAAGVVRIALRPLPAHDGPSAPGATPAGSGDSAAVTDTAAQLTRSRRDLAESERARLRADTEHTQVQTIATVLQRTLLPPTLSAPAGMSTAAYYHHASPDEVGGDFYDVFPLDNDTWGFFLGDVSGKGAGAAAVTSLTRYTLRAAAVFDRDPITVLHNLNTVLLHEFNGDDPRFCTVVFGIATPTDSGALIELGSGGHPPPLHLRANGDVRYVDDIVGGQLVGALRTPHFRSHRFVLAQGDVLLLYTDGVTEARIDPVGTRYDDGGNLEAFASSVAPTTPDQVVSELTGVLRGFGDGLQDDAALLALGVPGRR